MSNLMKGKKYGLTIPKAAQKATTSSTGMIRKKPSIFNQSDSDSDNSDSEDWVKKSMKKKADANDASLKKQTKIVMAKAMEEDPTVFQYDEVYDKLEEKKVVEEEKKKEADKKPKYISNLLKSAEIRKKDYERLVERKVQKEREAEGDMYADKEKFVTSAYRKKMEEMAEAEAEAERQAQMEDVLDVTKQNDLSGFYRHIYRQTWGDEKGQKDVAVKEEEPSTESPAEMTADQLADKVKQEMKKIKVESTETEESEQPVAIKRPDQSKKRAIRQKQTDDKGSSSSSDDSDSDSDSGSSSSDGGGEEASKKSTKKDEKADAAKKSDTLSAEEKMELRKQEMREAKERREKRKRKIELDESSSEGEADDDDDEDASSDEDKGQKKRKKQSKEDGIANGAEENGKPAKETKKKVDIWKKRTVGDVLEEARKRYWQRVAERGSSHG